MNENSNDNFDRPTAPISSGTPQFFNDAMSANDNSHSNTSSASGKHRFILIGAGIFVIIAIIAIVAVVVSRVTNNPTSTTNALKSYETLIRSGIPDGEIKEGEIKSLNLVGESLHARKTNVISERDAFLHNLTTSYDNLKKAYDGKSKYDDAMKEQEYVYKYLTTIIGRDIYEEELKNIYLKDGSKAVFEKIDNDFNIEYEHWQGEYESIGHYFYALMLEYEIYAKAECISGDRKDGACLQQKNGDTFNANKNQTAAQRILKIWNSDNYKKIVSAKIDKSLNDFKEEGDK